MCVLQSRACVYFYRAIYVRCARGRAAGEAEGGRNRSENAAAAPASVEVLETFTFGFSWFPPGTGPGQPIENNQEIITLAHKYSQSASKFEFDNKQVNSY